MPSVIISYVFWQGILGSVGPAAPECFKDPPAVDVHFPIIEATSPHSRELATVQVVQCRQVSCLLLLGDRKVVDVIFNPDRRLFRHAVKQPRAFISPQRVQQQITSQKVPRTPSQANGLPTLHGGFRVIFKRPANGTTLVHANIFPFPRRFCIRKAQLTNIGSAGGYGIVAWLYMLDADEVAVSSAAR
jgi:hypothetical protein